MTRLLHYSLGVLTGVGLALCAVGEPLFGALLLGAAAAAMVVCRG